MSSIIFRLAIKSVHLVSICSIPPSCCSSPFVSGPIVAGMDASLPFLSVPSCVMVTNPWPTVINYQLLFSSVCQANRPSQHSHNPDCLFLCVPVNEEKTTRDSSPDAGNLSTVKVIQEKAGLEHEALENLKQANGDTEPVGLAGRELRIITDGLGFKNASWANQTG